MNRPFLVAAVLILLSIWLKSFHTSRMNHAAARVREHKAVILKSAPVPKVGDKEESTDEAPSSRESAEPEAKAEPEASTPVGDAETLKAMPTSARLREEIRENPHSVPASQLAFSRAVAERIWEARKTETESSAYFSELEACALTNDPKIALPTTKAICLSSASQLADLYPSLRSRFDQMMASADPRASSLASATIQ